MDNWVSVHGRGRGRSKGKSKGRGMGFYSSPPRSDRLWGPLSLLSYRYPSRR